MKAFSPIPLHLGLLLLLLTLLHLPERAPAAGDVPAITLEELKRALDEGKIILIDVNGTTMFRKGHIPTAIDYRANRARLASLLPPGKGQLIVAYCGGPECNAYRAATEKAIALGYTNVRHFPDGIIGWIRAGEALEKAP